MSIQTPTGQPLRDDPTATLQISQIINITQRHPDAVITWQPVNDYERRLHTQ
jgi:hypothetical protein